MEKSKTFLGLSKFFLIVSAILFVVFLFSFFAIKKYPTITFDKPEPQVQPVVEVKEDVPAVAVAEKPAEKTPSLLVIDASTDQLQSENFRLENVNFGEEASLLVSQDENMPLEVYAISNRSFLSKNEDESKVVISWKSNKLTTADIFYSKNNGENPKTVSEGDFGFNHSIIIAGLELGNGYVYKIKSTDRWNNINETEYFGFYPGAKTDSIFEMITREFQGIFGWALK